MVKNNGGHGPRGSSGSVQYNFNGQFAGFGTWDNATNTLTLQIGYKILSVDNSIEFAIGDAGGTTIMTINGSQGVYINPGAQLIVKNITSDDDDLTVQAGSSGVLNLLGGATSNEVTIQGGLITIQGGATPQIGFFSNMPVARPTTASAAAAFVVSAGTAVNDASTFDGYTLKQVVKALRNLGLLA